MDQNYTNYWRDRIKEIGLSEVENELPTLGPNIRLACQMAIENYLREQQNEKDDARDKREKDTLKAAQDANQIARQTKHEMRITWVIGAIVAFILALWEKG